MVEPLPQTTEKQFLPIKNNTTNSDWKQSTIDFIQKGSGQFNGEGFADHCKWDSKQYSRGHGTRCYNPGEKVNKSQADLEFHTHLQPLFALVDKACYTSNQKIAMVSYMYNTGGYQMNFRTHVKNCNKNDIKYVMNNWGYGTTYIENGEKKFKRLRGLVVRRLEELALFNS